MRSAGYTRFAATLATVVIASHAWADPISLPSFNVNIGLTSVSGLSSGGFMAVQFEMAYSSIVTGVGIIAGGPYFCARGSLETAGRDCSCTLLGSCRVAPGHINVQELRQFTDRQAELGNIDPTSNVSHHRVWMFSGTADTLVPQAVMDDLRNYYLNYVTNGNIRYVNDVAAGHAMPTTSFGNSPCTAEQDPYMNKCSFDAAGEILKWIYGVHVRADDGTLSGQFIEFDQNEFLANAGEHDLDDTGWLYAPAGCVQGKACKLHVVFHGCRQGQSFQEFLFGPGFGRTFVDNAGYNEWADANDIVVLYPQVVQDGLKGNPQGCWDWWGYDDADYATKRSPQMAAIRAMIDRIAGVTTGPSKPP
jgi:hypothetical protein